MNIAFRGVLLLCLLAGGVAAGPGGQASAGRAEVLARLANVLEARYLDAALGRTLAETIRAARREGRFAAIEAPEAFAQALTRTLQATVPDQHLRVHYEPDTQFVVGTHQERMVRRTGDDGQARMVRRTGRIDPRSVEELARTNFGVDRAEVLPGGIGVLKISRFVPAELSRDALRAAIARLRGSSAVVVDLRGNIGGAPDAVAEVLSPFFPPGAAPRLLHAAENRALGIRSAFSTDPARGQAALARVPLYVVVDRNSASAAEMFAYAARRERNATIVGETTSGAGNGAAKHDLGNGFALIVSEWRILTGPGWERVGVRPDVSVAGDAAYAKALQLAGSRG